MNPFPMDPCSPAPTERPPSARMPTARAIAGFCLMLGLLHGCGGGGGVTGNWGGDDCIYKQMSFQRGGKVFITPVLFGMELPTSEGRYEVNGDKVTIRAEDGRSLTFTREGSTLRGGGLVGTCVRL